MQFPGPVREGTRSNNSRVLSLRPKSKFGSCPLQWLVANYAATGKLSRVQQNSVPSLHMRCMITASRRANPTTTFCLPRRLAIFVAHAFSHDHFLTFTSRTCAACKASSRHRNRIRPRPACFHQAHSVSASARAQNRPPLHASSRCRSPAILPWQFLHKAIATVVRLQDRSAQSATSDP